VDLERGPLGVHALEVEYVVDEADQAVGVGAGDAQQVERRGVDLAEHSAGEQPKRAADAGERRAQLMRDGGDELVLDGFEVAMLPQRLLLLPRQADRLFAFLGEQADLSLCARVRDEESTTRNDQRGNE